MLPWDSRLVVDPRLALSNWQPGCIGVQWVYKEGGKYFVFLYLHLASIRSGKQCNVRTFLRVCVLLIGQLPSERVRSALKVDSINAHTFLREHRSRLWVRACKQNNHILVECCLQICAVYVHMRMQEWA